MGSVSLARDRRRVRQGQAVGGVEEREHGRESQAVAERGRADDGMLKNERKNGESRSASTVPGRGTCHRQVPATIQPIVPQSRMYANLSCSSSPRVRKEMELVRAIVGM